MPQSWACSAGKCTNPRARSHSWDRGSSTPWVPSDSCQGRAWLLLLAVPQGLPRLAENVTAGSWTAAPAVAEAAAGQPGLFAVPKPSRAALGRGVSSWATMSGFVCHSPRLAQLCPAMSCLSCHSWDSAPAGPSCSQTPPAPSACPAQGDEGPGLPERLQALPSLPHRSKVQAGLLTLLHSIQAKPGSLSLRGGMGPG